MEIPEPASEFLLKIMQFMEKNRSAYLAGIFINIESEAEKLKSKFNLAGDPREILRDQLDILVEKKLLNVSDDKSNLALTQYWLAADGYYNTEHRLKRPEERVFNGLPLLSDSTPS